MRVLISLNKLINVDKLKLMSVSFSVMLCCLYLVLLIDVKCLTVVETVFVITVVYSIH